MKYSLIGIANNWIDRHRKTQRIRAFWQQHFTVEIEWRIENLLKPWGPSEVRLIQPREWEQESRNIQRRIH